MRALLRCGGGLAGLLLSASISLAQVWVHPVTCQPIRPNPDACGPGWYGYGPQGMLYGPNYYLRPPYPPFNGVLPGPTGQALMGCRMPQIPQMPANAGNGGQQGPQSFPSHPFIRSPRDFFMWNEAMEDQMGRDVRPNLIP